MSNQKLSPLQIAVYAVNCPNDDKSVNEVSHLIESYSINIVKDKIDIKEAKQIIAEDHGFINWNHLVDYLCHSNEKTLLNIYIDEVIEHLINTI
jgi:predicted metal-binding protein